MVLGHMENDGFHPHSGGSGIFSSQIVDRSMSGVDVRPSDKRDLDIRKSIMKHKEKFQERNKVKNLPESKPSEEQKKMIRERTAEDNFNKVVALDLSPKFKIAKLKEFRNKQGNELSDSGKNKLDTFIKNLEDAQKSIEKLREEDNEKAKKSGSDVLFPRGSSNPNTQGEKELDKFDEQRHRAEETSKVLEQENKNVDKSNQKLREQFEALTKKQIQADEQRRKIESSTLPPARKVTMLRKVQETKSDIEIKKRKALAKVKGQGAKQSLLSVGVL